MSSSTLDFFIPLIFNLQLAMAHKHCHWQSVALSVCAKCDY